MQKKKNNDSKCKCHDINAEEVIKEESALDNDYDIDLDLDDLEDMGEEDDE